MPINRSNDFRYIYANSFGLGLVGNEVTIRFAIIEDPNNPAESQQEQVSVITSLTGAKTMALMVLHAIRSFEEDAKSEIQTPNMEEIYSKLQKGGTPSKI